jgi:predicted Rossmann fold nucleotide-binding protein DprA/Smf involved in DNA uptake
MSGNLVELAQRFVRLSGELDSTRDAMKRLLMNGAAVKSCIDAPSKQRSPNENPTPAKRPGAKRPQSRHPKALRAAQVEETILELLQSSPGIRTAAIAKATAAQRSTTDERLKRLQAKGLVERDDVGWRTPA